MGLDVNNYNLETGELTIRGAKSRKDRLGYATNGSADALKDWLVVSGDDPGPLFFNVNKGGRITIRRMTDQAVLHILRKRADEAGVAKISPHDLRRSFISDLLDAGADISTAQKSPRTPMRRQLPDMIDAGRRRRGKRRNCCMCRICGGDRGPEDDKSQFAKSPRNSGLPMKPWPTVPGPRIWMRVEYPAVP